MATAEAPAAVICGEAGTEGLDAVIVARGADNGECTRGEFTRTVVQGGNAEALWWAENAGISGAGGEHVRCTALADPGESGAVCKAGEAATCVADEVVVCGAGFVIMEASEASADAGRASSRLAE